MCDLVVNDEGEQWGFLKVHDRRRCWQRLKAEDPWVVIGSPPCTAFSVLQGFNKHRADPAKAARGKVEAEVLLSFAASV